MAIRIIRQKRLAGIAFFISYFLLAGNVNATCLQQDLTGTWMATGMTANTRTGLNETFYCKIQLGSTGTIIGQSSSCKYRNSSGLYSSNITGGSLKVNSACRVYGSARLCPVGGSCYTMALDWGQLESNDVISAVARYGAYVASFTAIKR